MVQQVPSPQFHMPRGTTPAARRRQQQQIAQQVNNLSGKLVNLEASIAGGIFLDTDGATITFDMAVYSIHQVVLGGNRILDVSNVNVTVNQRFRIKLTQDGPGNRTVTWWGGISWDGGSAPTLTVTGNKSDWFGFITTGSGTYDGFVIGQNL